MRLSRPTAAFTGGALRARWRRGGCGHLPLPRSQDGCGRPSWAWGRRSPAASAGARHPAQLPGPRAGRAMRRAMTRPSSRPVCSRASVDLRGRAGAGVWGAGGRRGALAASLAAASRRRRSHGGLAQMESIAPDQMRERRGAPQRLHPNARVLDACLHGRMHAPHLPLSDDGGRQAAQRPRAGRGRGASEGGPDPRVRRGIEMAGERAEQTGEIRPGVPNGAAGGGGRVRGLRPSAACKL